MASRGFATAGPVLHTLPRRTDRDARAAADRRGDLRPRRHRERPGNPATAACGPRGVPRVGRPAGRRPRGGVSRHCRRGNVAPELESELLEALLAKDRPGIGALSVLLDGPTRDALRTLPDLYGGPDVIDAAQRRLPAYPEIEAALGDLRALVQANGIAMSIDLADLRGYHYHSGVVFAAYSEQLPSAIALGGRYDEVGKAFGRRVRRRVSQWTCAHRPGCATGAGKGQSSRRTRRMRPACRRRCAAREGGDGDLDLPGHESTRAELDAIAGSSGAARMGDRSALTAQAAGARIRMAKNVVVIGTQWGDEGRESSSTGSPTMPRAWCGSRAATTPATRW